MEGIVKSFFKDVLRRGPVTIETLGLGNSIKTRNEYDKTYRPRVLPWLFLS